MSKPRRSPLQTNETCLARPGGKMSQKLSFKDANGRTISGHFVVSEGIMTVIARNGRTATANVADNMLTPETLARAILFQLHERESQPEE